MLAENKTPHDLAAIVCSEILRCKEVELSIDLVSYLFETLFYTSLRTEEGQSVNCHVVWLDPKNPDPDPPLRITHDRWIYIPLSYPLPFDVITLTKLAKASDPRTSSFVVFPNEEGVLKIWGFIDQGNRYYEMLHYDSDSACSRPGLFQTSIITVAHLIAYVGFEKIAELRINSLLTSSNEVFSSGPIREILNLGISDYISEIREAVTENVFSAREHWLVSLEQYWISALCRLLLRSQNYRHGGAILITPDDSSTGLNIKYKIDYQRLCTGLNKYAIHSINKTHASDIIFEKHLDKYTAKIPTRLYLEESVQQSEEADARSELDGALWFISLLTRVDGLVLLNPKLDVLGFGVEITLSEPPAQVFLAVNIGTEELYLKEIDYNHYGTRHRSMMRYCAAINGSVGFVISQDGDVRAITKYDDKLIMWDNIRLRNEYDLVE